MTRDELITATRQLVDEGERLRADPSLGGLQVWLQRSDDLLAAAWGNMDRYHLAWLMVGKPKGIVRGRAMSGDEEAAYVRDVAEQKTAALRMSLDAVERQRMPFLGETGRRLGDPNGLPTVAGDASTVATPAVAGDAATPAVVERPPDRPPDRSFPDVPGLSDRLADARRRAEEHREHGERRAPRPDRMQR